MSTLLTHRWFFILALPVLVVVALPDAAVCGTPFEATLDGASNVPPQPVPGMGTATMTLNDTEDTLTYYIEFSGLVGVELAAHFHNAGTRDNGPVVHDLPLGSPKVGSWAIPPGLVGPLFLKKIYINIHTDIYVLGELRGNVMEVVASNGPGPTLGNYLHANYPNPFNPGTTIQYGIEERGHVSLKIYDAAGRLVRTLVEDVQSPDDVAPVTWDGRNEVGQGVSSGVYFYRLSTPGFTKTRKMVLLR